MDSAPYTNDGEPRASPGQSGAVDANPILRVAEVSKSYGATVALRSITLDVFPGEVHALLGENGAGKSTLVKILSGIVQPGDGAVSLGGVPYRPRSLMDARVAGVSTAFQELSLLPNLSVATNLMLPHVIKGPLGLASRARNEDRAAELLARFNASDISPRAIVNRLSLAQKQRVEIVRAISHQPRLLVLDEPTAALAEPEWLFHIVESLAAAGTGVLYISHRLSEVRRLCHRGTILRNGESIGPIAIGETSDNDIFRMMVGGRSESRQRPAPIANSVRQEVAVEVLGLFGETIHEVSFAIRQGEILGVAALEGQGQRELFRILGGVTQPLRGAITVDNAVTALRSPSHALRSGNGLAFVPEERKSEGIFLSQSTCSNITLPLLTRISRFGFINRSREMAYAKDEIRRVQLAERLLNLRISALSGGNQQKALIMRVLLSGARTLILFDPTRGVDVGTKQVIYDVIRRFAQEGGSVLIYSTELPELVKLSSRCLVMYRGRIAGELLGDELTEEFLVALATGHMLNDLRMKEPA
jgi:ribose transport system ATP-binding protein